MAQRWMTLPQAAAGMGVSVRTLERRITGGKIESRLCPDGRREVSVEVSDDLPDSVPDNVGPVSPHEQAAWVALKQADHIAESYDRQLSVTRDEADTARRAMRQAWSIATVSMVIAALALTWAARTSSQPQAEAFWSDTSSDSRSVRPTDSVSVVSDTPPVAVSAASLSDGLARPVATPQIADVTTTPAVEATADSRQTPASAATDKPTDIPWDKALGSGVLSEVSDAAPMCVRHDDGQASDNVSVTTPAAQAVSDPLSAATVATQPPSDTMTDVSAAPPQPADVVRHNDHDRQPPVAVVVSFCLPSQRLVHDLSLDARQAASIGSVDAHFQGLYEERMADSDRQMQAASRALATAQKDGNQTAAEDASVRLSQMLLDRREIRRQLDAQYLEAVMPLLDPAQAVKLKTGQ